MARFEHRSGKKCAICGAHWTECKHSNADVKNFKKQHSSKTKKAANESHKEFYDLKQSITRDIKNLREKIEQDITELKEEIQSVHERLRRTI